MHFFSSLTTGSLVSPFFYFYINFTRFSSWVHLFSSPATLSHFYLPPVWSFNFSSPSHWRTFITSCFSCGRNSLVHSHTHTHTHAHVFFMEEERLHFPLLRGMWVKYLACTGEDEHGWGCEGREWSKEKKRRQEKTLINVSFLSSSNKRGVN